MHKFLLFASFFMITACNNPENRTADTASTLPDTSYPKGSFGYDLNFLKKYHKDLLLLGTDSIGPQIIILPGYQGRVMTSSAEGNKGTSFGWVNHELISSGKKADHFNAFGGEERFWLGPEGGQFSIFFRKGVDFTFDNWFVPKELDTEPFNLVSSTAIEARFEKQMYLENFSGTSFDLKVKRNIRLLDKNAIDSSIGIPLPEGVKTVAFESENTLTNKGTNAWDKKTGLLSIWILSMLNASDNTTVAIPYKQGDEKSLGKIVTDDYFGKVPSDRLRIDSGLVLFKADGNLRSKIGIGPSRAYPLMASYDGAANVLTIVQFTLPAGKKDYVNSLWKMQDDPYSGDAANSYNDGPIDGKQLGKFYELESSSPAAALKPGESITHTHRTIHLKGNKENLEKIARKLLRVGLDKLRTDN